MSRAPRTILTPGEPDAPGADDLPAKDDAEPVAEAVTKPRKAPSMADLAARLEALEAENAALRSKVAPPPSMVYVPETPHGKQRLAASEYAGMTVAELMHAIDTGAAAELPHAQSALCRDGYYVSRRTIPA